MCVCVCVCVCEGERGRERKRERKRESEIIMESDAVTEGRHASGCAWLDKNMTFIKCFWLSSFPGHI